MDSPYNRSMIRSALGRAVSLVTSAPADVETDLIILPVVEGEPFLPDVPGLSDATVGRHRARAGVEGDSGQALRALPDARHLKGGARRAWRSSAPARRQRQPRTPPPSRDRRRRLLPGSGTSRGWRSSTACRSTARDAVQVITEGLIARRVQRRSLQEPGQGRSRRRSRCWSSPRPAAPAAALERAMERGRILGESSNLARELCNEPSNILTPSVFAERGAAIARDAGLTVEILDEDEIARLHMGLLLGVSRGSAEPPRVIVMTHKPAGAPERAGARAGRQGHHVRHGRHLHQAGGRHGADEGRHGRRRGRHRRHARHRAAAARRSKSSGSFRRPRTCRAGARPSRATSSPAPAARPSRCSTPTPKAG